MTRLKWPGPPGKGPVVLLQGVALHPKHLGVQHTQNWQGLSCPAGRHSYLQEVSRKEMFTSQCVWTLPEEQQLSVGTWAVQAAGLMPRLGVDRPVSGFLLGWQSRAVKEGPGCCGHSPSPSPPQLRAALSPAKVGLHVPPAALRIPGCWSALARPVTVIPRS